MDRVQVIKIESPGLGGTELDEEYTPIEPREDAVEAAGVYLQDASNRDETTLITRDGDDMTFQDGNNPVAQTLTQILSGGSLPSASAAGQVLISLDGATFTIAIPVIGNACWLADGNGELIVEG